MEFRYVLRMLHRELGMAQIELANALQVNVVTARQWGQGKFIPNRSTAAGLIDYTSSQAASAECMEQLGKTLSMAAKERLFQKNDELYTVKHFSISQLMTKHVSRFMPVIWKRTQGEGPVCSQPGAYVCPVPYR